MADSLGAWSNAPLAYALAEVRTERLSDIADYQEKLGSRLRDEYPIQRTMNSAAMVATGTKLVVEPSPDTAWEFATPDNRVAVILRPSGIVLHATKYPDSKSFLDRLHSVVTVVASEIPSIYVNRLGLRYIDFVLPRKGESPEQYVDQRLHSDLGLSDVTPGATTLSIGVYPQKGGIVVNVRYGRGRGAPGL